MKTSKQQQGIPVGFSVLIAGMALGWFASPLSAVELGDLPATSFTIEAEHFDYDGGKSVSEVNTMPYTGDEYQGLGAVAEVDYHDGDSASDLYREGEEPNVPMNDNLNGALGKERPGFVVTVNYKVGWTGGGEWYNYTREIPAGEYTLVSACSHGSKGAVVGGDLARVTEGAGSEEQTVVPLASARGPAPGGWGNNGLQPARNADGSLQVFELPGGPVTLRFTKFNGDFDWFTLVPMSEVKSLPADALIRAGTEEVRPFQGDNEYQDTPEGNQVVEQTVANTETAVFQVKVENDASESSQSLTVRAAESGESGWRIRYQVGAGEAATDITEAVRGVEGYRTGVLPAGEGEIITVFVTALPSAPGGSSVSTEVRVTSGGLLATEDAVRAVTHVALKMRSDLMIANEGDWNYAGERVFNLDAVAQTRFQSLPPGGVAVYEVFLENVGNAAGKFVLTGTPAPPNAAVRYLAPVGQLRFDGVSGMVNVGECPPGSRWTVEAWANPSALPGGRHTVIGGMGDCRDWGVVLHDGRWGINLKPPGGCARSPRVEASAEIGRWYHLAVACDGETATLYVDGEAVLSAPVQTDYVGYEQVRIGGEACCNGNNFPGLIREVRVWNRPLSAVEVRDLMHAPPPGDAEGLLGYWPLNEGSGSLVEDRSGNGRDGSLQGGVTWRYRLDAAESLDITDAATQDGWVSPFLAPGGLFPLRIEVTLDPGIGPGARVEALLTARSADTREADAVKAVLTANLPPAAPAARTFTTTGDFELGRMVGVEARSALDQLQLEPQPNALPFLWVPNSNEGTVSLVDTRTGRELGRYRTGPQGKGNPSRTTVDLLGNCWVANRVTATVIKIGLRFNGQFIDRNGNGIIETSMDLNGDGDITGTELLPWGEDECVLYEISVLPGHEGLHTPGDPHTPYGGDVTYKVNLQDPVRRGLMAGTHIPGDPNTPYANDYWSPGPRGLAVDVLNNLWLGTYGTKTFYYIDGGSGQIMKVIDVSSVNHTSYGAVIDRSGIVWSSGQNKRHVLRLDPADDSFRVVGFPHFVYGLGLDLSDRGKLYVSGWQDSKLSRLDLATETVEWTVPGKYQSRGVAVTDDGDIWTADSGPGTVTRFAPDGTVKDTIAVGKVPTGVAVDQAGKVWVVNNGDEYIHRINPLTDTIDLSKRLTGTTHYGYSDMTGRIVRNATTRLGIWTMRHDSGFRNVPWERIRWTGREPEDTALKVRVRSSNDQESWSAWEVAFNDLPLRSTPPGRYLEIEVQLQSFQPGITPVLEDLTVIPGSDVNLGDRIYQNDFSDGAGSAWSADQITRTPAGNDPLLGTFGNQQVTFRLDDLPPHTLAAIECDLVVAGPWVGNDPDAPSLFQMDLAGGLTLLRTTFHNGSPDDPGPGQAYPGGYPGGHHPPRADAAANDTLGFPGGDAIYHLLFVFSHTADSLVVNFSGEGLFTPAPGAVNVRLADALPRGVTVPAEWGLDNVNAYLTRVSAPLTLSPVGFNGLGQFQLELYGEVQATYTLEASADLQTWVPLETRKLTANPLLLTDPGSSTTPFRFYRAVLVP